jgi:hypothetical protein
MDEFKKYLVENQKQFNTDEPSPLVWEKVHQRVKAQTEKPIATAKVFSIRKLVQWSAAACILGLAGIGVWNLFNDKNAVKPSQEQVVTNEEKPNSAPDNSSNANINTTSNGQSTKALVATESIAPSASATQPMLSKKNQSLKSHPANNTAALSNNDKTLSALTSMETGFTQIINLQKGKISTTPMYAESASYFNEFKSQINQIEQEEKQIKKEISKKGLTDQQLDQLINLYQYKLTVLKQLQLEMNKTNNRYKQNRGPVDSTRAYFINI